MVRLSYFRVLSIAWFGALILSVSTESWGQSPEDQEVLAVNPGDAIELQLSGGQRKMIGLACGPQQFNNLVIEQIGIDVVIRLLDREGGVATEYDADPRLNGEERVDIVGSFEGPCRLSVEPRQRGARQGRVIVRVSQSRPATDSDRSLDEARRLATEVTKLWRAAKYQEAMPLAERVLAIRQRELGPEHGDVGLAVFAIANLYSDIPDFRKSEANYLRAIDIRSKVVGPEHFSLASIYNNLGVLYRDQGEYSKAYSQYQKALQIRERVLDPEHVLVASTINNLASLARLRGDEAGATSLYRRVLAIREKAFGPDHPDVATALNNLASPESGLAVTEPLYLRALAIREKVLAADHPDIAQTLYNLSISYALDGQYAKAETTCNRALAIMERSLGPEHPTTLYPLDHSAVIATSKGELTVAEERFDRAVLLREKVLGPFHPDLAQSLSGLANLYVIKGDMDRAIATQARVNEIVEYNTSLNLIGGSEREMLRYMRLLRTSGNQTLNLRFADAKGSAAATEMALSSVLQGKGRVLDVMSESIAALRRRLASKDRELLDELAQTNSKLSSMVLAGPGDLGMAEHRSRVAKLEARREEIERNLSNQAVGQLEARSRWLLSDVRKSIPEDTALIEFATYRPIDRRRAFDAARTGAEGNSRYAVFVVRRSGEVASVDLGETKTIDLSIAEFRNALRDPSRKDFETSASLVSNKLLKPLSSLLRGSEKLLISPDGQMNLIPFEALIDSDKKFLAEKHSITYLTSGRDLLRLGKASKTTGKPTIVAHPAFGDAAGSDAAHEATRVATTAVASRRRSVTSADSLRDTYFGPLNGTAMEARSIQVLFPESVAITGAKATETAVKEVKSPGILHLATHGFFLKADGPESEVSSARNPLLRSGLAFAGANRRNKGDNDGVLTALEASGLDLWGTKLVVLSACDTGLGEVRNGEGVYGLRRSFGLAGAESIVMSLWPVSDQVTRELMTGYYQNLKKGLGRGEALRQVRLEMIRRPNRRHPFYWASFIQSGEWANLEGRR